MKLTLGFSPCPNDTFIFDALVNKKIDTKGLDFDVVLEDVQTLNEWAKAGKLDVSKISYGALPLFLEEYIVLNAGGALGKGVGPLLIASSETDKSAVNAATIAIPGENTTAHLLFSLAYPSAKNKRFMKFNAIENFVLDHKQEEKDHLGVIIHENRFTYQQKGLTKIVDLGDYWEQQTGYPIPLGGIIIKRKFDEPVRQLINDLIRESIEYAFANKETLAPYVKQHSQEMEESVMRQHIDLYVNEYSLDLGTDGKAAVNKFLEIYSGLKQIGAIDLPVFVN
ncbi:MAG: 1,4-dihydroxy-6-naphthoate synthase [Chitinophagaceae bacterium]|nr:MAG: 1,4-dihydroxy-6-naphthoate synthase [Chitinophagaceae bacterium]